LPFSRANWIFEIKYDGYRALAARENGKGRLIYRRGMDASAIYPDITRALKALPFELIMDCEIAILDPNGKPSFNRLQRRGMLTRPAEIERTAVELPATLFIFDLLAIEGYDLRGLPLLERKALLQQVLPKTGPLRFADHIEQQGEQLFAEMQRLGLEGMVAKRADSPYRGGRSNDWQKVRIELTGDFAVVGYRPARQKGRTGFSGLHLGMVSGADLEYVGAVGSGFSEAELTTLSRALEASRRDTPPVIGVLPPAKEAVWVDPQFVVEVRYKEFTRDRLLRQPTFLRIRDDKRIEDCHLEATARDEPIAPPTPAATASAPVERKVAFSNLDKIFWPDEGYTKGDLIDYYRSIAPYLLPYLKHRPVVLTRYPDGIAGKSFFQKDAPEFVPGWIHTERIWSEHTSRDIDYFICDDIETLLYVINMAAIPLHVWSSRVGSLENPDYTIIDLDPKSAPFTDVVEVALAVRRLCDAIGLPSHPKTSGASGMHVLIPLGGACTYAQSRALAELLSRVIADELPKISTMTRAIAGRDGRVYLDWGQNGHGRTIAGAFSARPVPGAGVSTPLEWDEVTPALDPKKFNIKSVPVRVAKWKRDPLLPVLDERPDLPAALARLAERMKSPKS
jgi:bifunctional non-homologous end joining protein LigD